MYDIKCMTISEKFREDDIVFMSPCYRPNKGTGM